MLDAQIRAPENAIENVPLTEAHVANVKASIKAVREKAAQEPGTRADAGPDARDEVTPSPAGSRNPAGARAGRRPGGSLDRRSRRSTSSAPRRSARSPRRSSEAPPARLLVLRGLPRAFSAGVEVAAHAPEPDLIEGMLAAMRRVLCALVETPAVTLAAVSGACLGGGAEIVAACDLVLVAEDARIGFPEIRLACFPPGGSRSPAAAHRARRGRRSGS